MKNSFDKVFHVLGSRAFLISFGASLAIVLLIFLIGSLMAAEGNRTEMADVFRENDVRTLRVPTPLEVEYDYEPEYEPCDKPPYPTLTSVLTGLRMYEGYASRRPLAVVINNIRVSLPQSGIAAADVVYEVLAEGDVTRLVAIFQSYFPEKIGSVRSARDYFIDFAWNHDAIFVFHGASQGGYARIRSTGINNMDGLSLEGRVFWRDRSFPYWATNSGTRSLEHSSFTGREQIESHIESAGLRNYMNTDPALGFSFGEIPNTITSLGEARYVVVPFSRNYTRRFIFDEEENIYRVKNNAGPHRCADTAEQAAVTNILIQLTQMRVIDNEGRRNVTTVGSGRGYLITGGKHFPVLWEKSSHTAPMRWTFEDGTPLVISSGRTWICVFQNTDAIIFDYENE